MVVAFPEKHLFTEKDDVPLIEIARETYLDRIHCEFREDFLAFCKKQSVDPSIIFRSQREDWIQDFVRDGVGVTVLPEYSLLKPTLDYRPVSEPSLMREVDFFVADRNSKSDGLHALIEMVDSYPWQSRLDND